MRTALSVVLTDWPPAPLARNTSMRRSLSSILMSTSSASGSTATVAAEVWMRPCASVAGTRCTRCTPDFEFEPREHALAGDVGDDLLVAAESPTRSPRDDLDLPAHAVGVALIHAEQVAGEQRRLLAAGAGAHFEDGALLVGGILGQELHLELALELLDLGIERAKLRFGERSHVGIGRRVVDHLIEIVALLLRPTQRGDGGDDRIELGELARKPHIALLIGAGGESALHRLPACDEFIEFIGRNRGHAGLEDVASRPEGWASGQPCGSGDRRDGRAVCPPVMPAGPGAWVSAIHSPNATIEITSAPNSIRAGRTAAFRASPARSSAQVEPVRRNRHRAGGARAAAPGVAASVAAGFALGCGCGCGARGCGGR